MMLFVITCVSLLRLSQAFFDDDPCYMMTVSDLSKDTQVLNMTIPAGCMKGHVDWHYPKGNLLLEAKLPKAGSVLCVEESWATDLGALRDITNGASRLMAMPIKDSPSCTSRASTHPQILLSAPDMQLYMTTFEYSIRTK